MLTQRRQAHGLSVAALARLSGVSRQTITAAEAGAASHDTYLRLEEHINSLDEQHGFNSRPASEGVEVAIDTTGGIGDIDTIEFDITGKTTTTSYRAVVKGSIAHSDELRRQVVELKRDLEADDRGK